MPADALVFVCTSEQQRQHVEQELAQCQRLSALPATVTVLVVADPCPNLGSGGSLLNALLVLTEHLCGREGRSLLSSDVLADKRVFLCYLGIEATQGVPNGSVCLGLTQLTRPGLPGSALLAVSQMLHCYNLMSRCFMADDCPAGLYLCSADWLIDVPDGYRVDWRHLRQHSICAFSLPAQPELARHHGVFKCNTKGQVSDILYQAEEQVLAELCNAENQLRLVCSLLWLSVPVLECLLQLQATHPLSCCTYLGVDSGSLGFKLSLYFDFLLPCCADVSKSAFVSGRVAHKSAQSTQAAEARRLIWDRMQPFTLHAAVLPCTDFVYLDGSSDWHCPAEQLLAKMSTYTFAPELAFAHSLCSEPVRQFLLTRVRSGLCRTASSVLPVLFTVYHCRMTSLLLAELDSLAADTDDLAVVARIFSSIAELLAIMSDGRGGVRSGPAQHSQWTPALNALQHCTADGVAQLAAVRAQWLATPTQLIRAARHYEAAAQVLIRHTVMRSVQHHLVDIAQCTRAPAKSVDWLACSSAARIDLAGGWSDTPPITYECHPRPAAVLNLAILVDGKRPIGAKCRRSAEAGGIRVCLADLNDQQTWLTFDSVEEVADCHNKPSRPGALACAILVASGVVDLQSQLALCQQLQRAIQSDGLEIWLWSELPAGSGLGTSSILMCCLLRVLYECQGLAHVTDDSLLHVVLYAEQLLTTGGGWQDQVGGFVPGLKLSTFTDGRINVRQIPLTAKMEQTLNRRLLLVYTGQPRLAKNLLQEVIRAWFRGEPNIRRTVDELVVNANEGARLFEAEAEDPLAALANVVRKYQQHKLAMAPGSVPSTVDRLLLCLQRRQLILAGWLAGAGGGGFVYLLLSESTTANDVRTVIEEESALQHMTVHAVTVCT